MIRDAINIAKFNKKQITISTIIDEYFKDYPLNFLNEGSIEDDKKKICARLKDVDDTSISDEILIILNKDFFDTKIDEISKLKLFDTKTKKQFTRYFYTTIGTPDDKIEFLNLILTTGIWSAKGILSAKSPESLTSAKIQIANNDFIKRITPILLNWKADGLAGASTGKGEAISILYIKDALKAYKGDVNIDGKLIEVKTNTGKGATGGRLMGPGNSWMKATSAHKKMLDIISPYAINGLAQGKGSYNFNTAHFKDWNVILKANPKDSVNILSSVIKTMYPNENISSISKWVKKDIDDDGGISKTFLAGFAEFQFEYYKSIEKFHKILFVGISSNNILMVSSKKEYRQHINNGIIKIGSFDWGFDQNTAFQTGI